jgi:hypothetical protein
MICESARTPGTRCLWDSNTELLLVNVVSPADPVMKLLVFVRPTAAAKPPPRAGGPPPVDARPPQPVPLPDAAAPPADTIPQFPWPPPKWTLRTVLPPGLGVAAEGEQLGVIVDRLRASLRRAQISEWTVYGIDSDGFSLVARLEHIDEAGRPAADRWSGNLRPRRFRVADYLQALFTTKPRQYRIIAFVVTAKAVIAGAVAPDRETIERLWQGGASDLPKRVRTTSLPPSGRVEALVYEFFRPSEDDPPAQVTTSGLRSRCTSRGPDSGASRISPDEWPHQCRVRAGQTGRGVAHRRRHDGLLLFVQTVPSCLAARLSLLFRPGVFLWHRFACIASSSPSATSIRRHNSTVSFYSRMVLGFRLGDITSAAAA